MRKVIKLVYLCDPAKNKACKKANCQTKCFFTKVKAYSKDGIAYHADRTGDKIKPGGKKK